MSDDDLLPDDGPARAHLASRASTADAAPAQRDLVAGLEKGLQVIEAFDQDRPRLTIAEVAQRTGLTRAAARRYLITLAHLGFVSQDRRLFALTPKVLRLAQSYMHSARLPRIVQPELHKLAYAMKEASSAGTLDGNDVICIAATSAGRVISSTLQPGTRVPAHCTSNGRVLLAALPQADVDAWIARQTLRPFTPRTVVLAERLRIEIAHVRAQGYACVDQELELGLRTIAVPLRNYRGETVAALNISVHAQRMTMDQLVETCLPPLRQSQAMLRQLL
ncbi:IclR family transcriptional regulator C-terminal domain-containing protein [Aquincola sp. MAHUQ-54]|uniref:IclR family transcriptional regulator C-terminal domain-containing protein n=1 Tax=Aquincola agrisoli TaxID=3119538 RepID=A0AAW9QH21_9BURK